MLGDAHGVENARFRRFCKCLGDPSQIRGRDSRYLGRPFGREGVDRFPEFLKSFGPLGNKLPVLPSLLNDDVHETIDPGNIGPWPVADMNIGNLSDLDSTGLDHNQPGSPLLGPENPARDQRVGLGGVGPGDQDTVCILDLRGRVGHGTTAKSPG